MTARLPAAAGAAARAAAPLGLSWPLLVAAAGFLAAFNNSVLVDPDTYWHLATAKWMAEHLAIPAADPFSHTLRGAPWVAHEWLAELFLGAAYGLLGWSGPVLLAAGAYALALALLCRYLLRHLEPIYALCLTALAALLVMDHLLARPHALVLPLLAAWCIALLCARERGAVPAWPWALALTAWANLHGSFVLALGLAGLFAGEALLEARPGERRQAAWAWGRFLLLSFLAALATPHGLHGLSFAAGINGMGYTLDNVGEWRSPDFHHFQPVEVGLLAGALAVLLRGVRLPPLRAGLVLGLLHMALVHVRHGEILGLVAAMAMAEPVGRQWGRRTGPDRAAALDRWFDALAAPARPLGVAAVVAPLAAIAGVVAQAGVFHPAEANTPEAALDAVRPLVRQERVFNAYGFGGYLIFAGIPTYVDGRADLYGDAFISEYGRAIRLETPERLLQLLDEHGIGWTLLTPEQPVVALLDRLPGWRRAYADDIAVVHVRQPRPRAGTVSGADSGFLFNGLGAIPPWVPVKQDIRQGVGVFLLPANKD